MRRQVLSFAAITALTLGMSFGSATVASAATPVDAHGSLHCVLVGKMKLTPPLVIGGTAPSSSFVAKIKSSSCTGTSHVTSIAGTVSATLPSNNCSALGGAFPAATFGPAKMKGAAKYNPTTIHMTAGGHVTVVDPPTLDLPGAGTSSATGSFSGQHPTIHFVFGTSLAELGTACMPKTKGVKGSGGLKQVTVAAGSFIDIAA